MKLSEKGKENLAGFGFAHNCDGAFSLLDDYEFEPDDFQGAVVLTVEEAKRVESLMNDLIDLYNKESIKIFASGFETIYMVKHRIEQVEKGYE